QLQRFFQSRPVRRALITMLIDTLLHFAVMGRGGGNIHHRGGALLFKQAGLLLGVAAFTTTGGAQNQVNGWRNRQVRHFCHSLYSCGGATLRSNVAVLAVCVEKSL